MKTLKVSLASLLIIATSAALACPGCKDALSSGSSVTNPWGSAYNWSIMFMLAMVLTMTGGITYFVYRLSRAEDAKHATGATPELPRAPRWRMLALPAFAVVYIGVFALFNANAASARKITVNVPTLSDDTFRSASLINRTMLVDFNATWCASCITTAPEFENFVQNQPADFKSYIIDTDASPITAKAFGVDTLPCMILFHEGKEVARRSGVVTEAELKEFVSSHSK